MLSGEAARQAWRAVDDVAEALATVDPPRNAREASLANGTAGLAVFFCHLAEARDDDRYADIAVDYLEHSLQALADYPMAPSLFEGFSGVGWAVAHLESRLLEEDDGVHQTIDESLLELLRHPARLRDYDLVMGFTGFAVYALQSLSRPAARECLELVVTRLAERADEREAGVAWYTAPELLIPQQRELAPRGYYNLGVAHGVPAVAAVLGMSAAAGVAGERARPLLDDAVAWLLSQELDGDAGSRFPNWVGEDVEPERSRLAWCYGDLGLAATLLLAARSVGRRDWEREAVRVARLAAERPITDSGLRDVGLCHGAAGIGHLFNRLHQATGEEVLARASRSWFQQAFAMRRPGEGVAGFRAWTRNDDGELVWSAEKGVLTGAAGVALALLAAVSPMEPDWDQMLLVSVPPSGG